MRYVGSAITAILVFASTSAFAGGSDEGMRFLDLELINRSDVLARSIAARRIQIAELPIGDTPAATVPSAFEAPAQRVKIDARDLVPFESGLVRIAGSDRVVRLPIGGRPRDLVIVDVTRDPSADLYHVAALILGTDKGYARFTVSLRDGAVVGTVYDEGSSWRIAPAEREGEQLVQQVRQALSPDTRYDTSLASRSVRATAVETRHVQLLRLAEINPRRFHIARNGAVVSISGEEIEHLDFSRVLDLANTVGRAVDVDTASLARELSAAVERMRPLTLHDGAVELSVQSSSRSGQGEPYDLLVRVNQVLDGIPVEPSGLVSINPSSGAIRYFGIVLVTPQQADDRVNWLTEAEAVTVARNALLSGVREEVTASDAAMRYFRLGDGEIAPQWVVHLRAGAANFVAIVDARTRDTSIHSTQSSAGEYWQVMCDSNGQPINGCAPLAGSPPPGQWKVTDQNPQRPVEGVYRCKNPQNVCDPRYVDAFETVEAMEDFAQGAGGQPDWWRVDVAVDRPGLERPAYDNSTRTVLLPPPGESGMLPGVDPTSPAARQVVDHEVMHHHQNATGGPSYTDPSELLRSVKEGLADAGVALKHNYDWHLYDGILEPGDERDLATPRSIPDYAQLVGIHQKGQVFGNMVYRMSSKANVSTQSLSHLIFETYRRMVPNLSGDPNGWEMGDVYEAMLEAAATDPYLTEAIYEVWVDMEGAPSNNSGVDGPSGGTPPPPSAPPPPSYVDGHFQYCLSGASIHQVNWMPIFAATSYHVYYSVDGFTYNYSGSVTSPETEMYAYANVRVAVKSCNSAGCSWLSNDFYFMIDDCV